MASKKTFIPDILKKDVLIEVIRKDNLSGKCVKKEMTFGNWKDLKKQPGHTYIAYQLKFSQFTL